MENGEHKRDGDSADNAPNFGGLLDGMANLLGKLGELAEKGEHLRRTGDFQSDDGKSVAGSYGFSVRFGPGGQRSDAMNVAPVQKNESAKATPVRPDAREPQVDTFVEADHILVVAEMPGIRVEDIAVEFSGTQMTLVGASPRVRFEKTLPLGHAFSPDDVEITMNNGVVEIHLKLTSPSDDAAANDGREVQE